MPSLMNRLLPLLTLMIAFLVQNLWSQAYPDRHTTNATDGWISCQSSANPNSIRGNSHWIRYDFGQPQSLYDITFWNMNHPDHAVNGMKNIVIDYSIDGITWFTADTFTIPKAPASGYYEGIQGPDLGGLAARHLLITALDNHGGGCYGLSEIRVYTQDVTPNEFVLDFSPCESDGIFKNLTAGIAPNGTYSGPGVINNGDGTFDFDVGAVGAGTYTINYNYSGGNLNAEVTVKPCTDPGCPDCETCNPNDVMQVNGNPIASGDYSAHKILSSGRVSSSGNVEFSVFIDAQMDPGFEVNQSGLFNIDFRPCLDNKLLNPSFENDIDDWQFSNWQGGNASWSMETNNPYAGAKAVRVVTSNTTGDTWRIQLRQGNQSIAANTTYKASFYAKAQGGGIMSFQIHLDEDPWTTYLYKEVTLFDHWTRYEFEFTSTATVSNNVRVTALYGEYDGTFWIDEVKYYEK